MFDHIFTYKFIIGIRQQAMVDWWWKWCYIKFYPPEQMR